MKSVDQSCGPPLYLEKVEFYNYFSKIGIKLWFNTTIICLKVPCQFVVMVIYYGLRDSVQYNSEQWQHFLSE